MDINSLLSPVGSNPPSGSSAANTPEPPAGKRPDLQTKRTSSSLSQQIFASPSPSTQHPENPSVPPGLTASAGSYFSPQQNPAASHPPAAPPPPPSQAAPALQSPPSQLPPARYHRPRSKSGIDTLADLASLQHQPPPPSQRPRISTLQSPQSAVSNPPSQSNVRDMRQYSNQSLSGIAPESISPRNLTAVSLSEAESRGLAELKFHLSENPADYTAYARLLGVLRKGFIDHVYPSRGLEPEGDPHAYELLSELRSTRQKMDERFSFGEAFFLDWIADEKLLVKTPEDRLSVTELCMKAVEAEPYSVQLWKMYGDYMYELWSKAFDAPGLEANDLSDEDKLICREIFTWPSVLDVWSKAATRTKWNLSDGHVVWDRYLELLVQDLSTKPTLDQVQAVMDVFQDRLLKQPHATWDETSSQFSQFVTRYQNADYEAIMAETSRMSRKVKEQYLHREPYELKILKARQMSDMDAEWTAYIEYLEWEVESQGPFSFPLINALFERAITRFPSDANIWEDYVEYLIEHPHDGVSILDVCHRGTRHCPWSGGLWAHRLLTMEAEGSSFDEVEGAKHDATSTGLLELKDLEQLLKVYISWCGFLTRSAIHSANEDAFDIAEVGIKSALEHVREIGEEKYGNEYKGDPMFRLEKIQIKFFFTRGEFDAARAIWRKLTKTHGQSYDFWYRYYIFEMCAWAREGAQASRPNTAQPGMHRATQVLREALKQIDKMDMPEHLCQMFLSHCEQHETVKEFRLAIIEYRKTTKLIARRREREAAAAATAAAHYQQSQPVVDAPEPMELVESQEEEGKGKRKRDDNAEPNQDAKKTKSDGPSAPAPKRDREHTTLTLKKLPEDVTETDVRRFFKDCGTINRIKVFPASKSTKSATVEFDSRDDALYAQTRDFRKLKGQAISVALATSATLWVTNYPSIADEAYIRSLFKEVGEVVEVRFPSLKFNQKRRFCYVQMTSADQAEAATQLDGQLVEDGLHLVVKVSDPSVKTERHDPVHEGREIFIGQLPYDTTDDELQAHLQSVGAVERLKIPRNVQGKSKGFAFAAFATREAAETAISDFNQQPFKGKKLNVKISEPHTGGAKRSQTTIIHSASPEPSQGSGQANGMSPKPAAGPDHRERTVALLNVPDTINDARIRALVEPHGALRKIILRPDHQGAIIELDHVQDVGKVSMAIDGHEIAPGRRIRIGTTSELMKSSAEKKTDKIQASGPKNKQAGLMSAGPVSRPSQPGARRGGRKGGLGSLAHGVGMGRSQTTNEAKSSTEAQANGTESGASAGAAKSNSDFRALFMKGKEESDK